VVPATASVATTPATAPSTEPVQCRIALQADLAAVYAEQGEVDHAASLLTEALGSAAQAGLLERVKRVIGVRYNLLTNVERPLVAQLDEQTSDVDALKPGNGRD
jgi:hypothetical protein